MCNMKLKKEVDCLLILLLLLLKRMLIGHLFTHEMPLRRQCSGKGQRNITALNFRRQGRSTSLAIYHQSDQSFLYILGKQVTQICYPLPEHLRCRGRSDHVDTTPLSCLAYDYTSSNTDHNKIEVNLNRTQAMQLIGNIPVLKIIECHVNVCERIIKME